MTTTAVVRPAGSPTTLEFKEFHGRLVGHGAKQLLPDGEEDYVREALVAITNNTDDGGDVILPGAFNFKRRPKIVWSHDLKELVGKVLEYEELLPGDSRLLDMAPDLVAKGLGALWFKIEFDPQDPESFKAFRKVVFHEDLGWSIGYEVDPKGFKNLPDGRRALTKLYVWEGSPTTFGMNEEARTLNLKSALADALKDLKVPEERKESIVDLVALLTGGETEEEEGREKKSWPPLAGSFEDVSERVREAVQSWAESVYGDRGPENDWWVSMDGTFDDSVVATIRVYSGDSETGTYRFGYTMDDAGAVELGDPEEVEVQSIVTPATGNAPAEEETTTTSEASDEADLEAASAALEGLDLKGLLAETKKGRVLSAANEAALSGAADAIAKVLAAVNKDPDEDETTDEKVLARQVVPKGKGGKVVTEVPEGDALDAKDLLEMELLANS